MRNASRLLCLLLMIAACTSCSLDKLVVRLSMPVVEGRMQALLRESDYSIARSAIPGHIKSLESMLVNDPANATLHVYTAYAYYSYAFAFVEDEDRTRAGTLYFRCMEHGKHALQDYGIDEDLINGPTRRLQQAVDKLGARSVKALFWTSLCWAKVIEMNRDQLLNVLQWHKAIIMMKRVFELDEAIYLQGPRLFFGVYYGSRSPLLGGKPLRSEDYFRQAREATRDEMLIVDVLQARYLERQRGDRQAFHDLLTGVVNAPDSPVRDYALINAVARHKARHYLQRESEWFGGH